MSSLNFQQSKPAETFNTFPSSNVLPTTLKLTNLQGAQKNQAISQLKVRRSEYSSLSYISFVFAATLLPLLNQLILFTQSYHLSWQDNFASIQRENFNYYYIGIGYYLASILIFLLGSASTPLPLKQILKLYLLVDSNQICGIAASLCYVCLHLVYLCRDLAGNSYDIRACDIFYLLLLILNNFCFLGHFRTALVCYRWTPTITLTFKILIFASSLTYFAYGVVIIVGKDNLSSLLGEANSIVQSFVQSTDFGNLGTQIKLDLLQQMNNLSGNVSTIQNLISLFVFTSFANICEVLNRMNDFDKSSDLKPMYLIQDEEQSEEVHLAEQLQKQVTALSLQLTALQMSKIKQDDILSSEVLRNDCKDSSHAG